MVWVEISGGIHDCLGPTDPGTSNGGITVKHGSLCFLFGPRNPFARYRVNPSCIGACFGPLNP